jgi:hypothetical protein
MPNWCHNNIQFEGGEHLDQIKEILNKNPDGILRFEDFGHERQRRVLKDCQNIDIYEDKINISLLTGWSPPRAFLAHMNLMFPGTKITMQYCEAINAFAGESIFEAGLEDKVSFWRHDQLGNWDHPSLSDLEDEERSALYEALDDAHAYKTEDLKELMDKVFTKDLSDFMFQHFGGPVGG